MKDEIIMKIENILSLKKKINKSLNNVSMGKKLPIKMCELTLKDLRNLIRVCDYYLSEDKKDFNKIWDKLSVQAESYIPKTVFEQFVEFKN